MTLTSNVSESIIVNGRQLKSINQYYNKEKVNIQSNLIKNHNKYNSNKLLISLFTR
jgi:hypothetical protein